MPVVARPSRLSDAAEVDALSQKLYGGGPGVSRLVETALLCFTAVDSETGSIIGFLCIDDSASVRLGSKPNAAWLESVSKAHRFNPNKAAFVWAAACSPDYELEAAGVLLKAAFLSMSSLHTLMLATDSDITFSEPGLAASFNRLAHDRDSGSYLYETSRAAVLPPLTIRRALVEDHDDLVPVLEASEKRYPALAKLPDSCRPLEAFALSRMVAGQDEQNCVLVAMSGKKLVGFLVLTSEVNTGFLLDCFDLHPFDNFLPEETYDFQYMSAKNSVHEKKLDLLKEKLGAKPSQDRGSENGEAEDPGEQQAEAGDGGEAADPGFDMEAAAAPSDEEIRQEMRSMFESQDDDAETTLIAITMFCILEEFETQALEFLNQAFDAFPEKSYCVVTLPHNSEEPALMANMTRLSPLPGATCPEVLYLFNKNALLDGFEVRAANDDDAEGVSVLVAGMPNSDDIDEAFRKARGEGLAVVACCQDQVVGLLTICPSVDLAMLQANYSLTSLISMEQHAPQMHGEIDILCMNPIFAHKHRELLAGAQRLLKRTCLYYALPPGQAPPDMLEMLQQVPPLHRPASEANQAQFALYMFARKNAFLRKRAVNAQIVVVGTSECGLAAVERLLLDTHLSFNCITLLAPSGISAGGPVCEYTAGLVARLGLEARVTLVDAELIGLGVQQHVAELSDGSQLPYDLLLVTSGLQEQTRTTLGQTDPEVVGMVVNAMELSADFSLADALKMDHIIVYGNTLEAYQALTVLDKNEATPKMSFMAPEGQCSKFVDVLHECASLIGRKELQIPEPRPMTLTSMLTKEGSAKPRAYFTGPAAVSGQEEQVLDLLVACQKPDVSPWVFACLNDAGIVYDGRIVVDGAFRTSDPSIYAAGTAAKLSRRYGRDVHFEHYNSKECGQKLAESVISYFLGTQQPDVVPTLRAARLVGCEIPGGMTFLMAGTPSCMMNPSLDAPMGGEKLQSITTWGIMTIIFDASQRVMCVAYLGKKEMQGSRLSSLIGLHMTYLNDLISKHKEHEAADLVLFVSEAWVDLLHHEEFGDLRAQLKASLKASSDAGAGVEELEMRARVLVLDFLKAHHSQLPKFTLV